MATYLLTWNPDRWHWTEEEFLEDIAQIDNLGLEVFNRVNDNSLDGASAPTIKESNQATVYSLYGLAVSLAAFFHPGMLPHTPTKTTTGTAWRAT